MSFLPLYLNMAIIPTIEEDMFVTSVDDLMNPLLTIKENLLNSSVFPGCGESFHFCLSSPTSCPLLKAGVQCLIDNKEILFEKTFVPKILMYKLLMKKLPLSVFHTSCS